MVDKEEQIFEMLFMQMIMSLNEAAMIQLGKIVNPATGKAEKALDQARGTIDLMRTLQKKTEGNLGQEEKQLLDQSIMNLQMNFVYEQEAAAKVKAEVENPAPEKNGEDAAPETEAEKKKGEGEDQADEGEEDDDSALGKRPGMDN